MKKKMKHTLRMRVARTIAREHVSAHALYGQAGRDPDSLPTQASGHVRSGGARGPHTTLNAVAPKRLKRTALP